MKARLIALVVCLAGNLTVGIFHVSATMEVSAGVSIHSTAEFYDPLAAHGTWVEVGSYGRCWHPAGVVVGWRPYCNGYWEWTDCGWYWVSDEPWAWACYHYGTWVYDSDYGWIWVPGIEWAPAWVYWRVSVDYIGWAPCPPHRHWYSSRQVEPSAYVFVETRHFEDHHQPSSVIVNNKTILDHTTLINHVQREDRKIDDHSQKVVINAGPRVDTIEKATGKSFKPVSIRQADRRTFDAVPATFKHAAPESPKKPQPANVHELPKPAPERKPLPGGNQEIPHNIPPNKEVPSPQNIPPNHAIPEKPIAHEQVIPPSHNELPVENNRPTHEIVPPQQSPLPQPTPVQPHENQPSKGRDKDKDRDRH